jgi:hypothetical protein
LTLLVAFDDCVRNVGLGGEYRNARGKGFEGHDVLTS